MPAQTLVKATNQILVYGKALKLECKVGATATKAKMLPGTIVVRDTNDNEVMEAAGTELSVLGVIDVDPTHDMDDPYDVGENIPILAPAPGAFLMLRMKANEDVTQGDIIIHAADGLVIKQILGALGVQVSPIGQVWESWNEVAIEHVLCLWNPSYTLLAAV